MVSTFVNGKWLYGDSWDKFPVEEGEIWQAGNNKLAVFDITKSDNIDFFGQTQFDMSYVDPPWNTGNINSFYTKAGIGERKDFDYFILQLLKIISKYSPNINYMEMGSQNLDYVTTAIQHLGGSVSNIWDITYYKKHKCHLIRYGFNEINSIEFNFSGIDDDYTPHFAIKLEKNINSVLDLCTGRGLTGRTAFALGKTFYGTELNKRRIACLLDFYNQNNLLIKISKES